MCLSIFLAQVIGCYSVLVALAMLVHQVRFKKTMNEFVGSHPLIFLTGGLEPQGKEGGKTSQETGKNGSSSADYSLSLCLVPYSR